MYVDWNSSHRHNKVENVLRILIPIFTKLLLKAFLSDYRKSLKVSLNKTCPLEASKEEEKILWYSPVNSKGRLHYIKRDSIVALGWLSALHGRRRVEVRWRGMERQYSHLSPGHGGHKTPPATLTALQATITLQCQTNRASEIQTCITENRSIRKEKLSLAIKVKSQRKTLPYLGLNNSIHFKSSLDGLYSFMF